MKKKILSTLTMFALSISLVACGGSKDSEEKESEKTEAKLQDEHAEDLEKLSNIPLPEGIEKLEEYGFTPTFIGSESDQDLTDFINNDATDEEKEAYTITEIKAQAYEKSAKVYIASETEMQGIENAEKLSQILDTGHAWLAVKEYGEYQYPNGFDLDYIAGRISEEAIDENTWFLKATCNVTDDSGVVTDFTCEARVTGTNDEPNVVDFIVY